MCKKFFVLFLILMILCIGTIIYKDNISLTIGESVVVETFNNVDVETIGQSIDVIKKEDIEILGKELGLSSVKLNLLGVPVKKIDVEVTEPKKLIPVGVTLGIRINTKGVLVLGTGNVTDLEGKTINPASDKVFSGDIIYKIDDVELKSKEELMEYVEKSEKESAILTISHNNEVSEVEVPIVKSQVDNVNKIGIWVRDSTQGIGTMTYIDPENNQYAALGHGIVDVDTKELMNVKEGKAYLSSIVSVTKGEKGSPGELVGEITIHDEVANVENNKDFGIYGTVHGIDLITKNREAIEIAREDEITEGSAYILCSVNQWEVEEYEVEIMSIDFKNKNNKNFIIKITDDELLSKTSGIVQGMSGSPIIQNNKFVGAVTHVFVQDPTKGYGIYIENMID
ncbi:MAG: SpoIVB peptidase [Lachnospirales bacterium]